MRLYCIPFNWCDWHMCTCSKEEKYIYILRERTHKKERKKKRKTNMDNECMTFRNGRTIKVNAFVHHPSPAPLSQSRDDVGAGWAPVWKRAPCFYRFYVISATVPSLSRYTLHVNSLSPLLSISTPHPVTVKSYFSLLFIFYIFPVTWAFRVQCELSTPHGLFLFINMDV